MIVPLIILQVLTFVGLVVAFWLLFHRQQRAALLRLNSSLKQTLSKEAELKKKSAEAAKLHDDEVDKGRQEAKELAEAAKKQAQQILSDAKEKARLEAERMIQKGKEELERLKRTNASEVQRRASELAVKVIKYTFSQKGKAALQKQIIEEAIDDIKALDKEKFVVKSDEVLVKTAVAIESAQKQQLKKVLSEKMGHDVKINEEIDEGLIAGLVVKIDSMVIDGSLMNKLKKAIPLLGDKD